MTCSARRRAASSASRLALVKNRLLQKPAPRWMWWPISRFCSTVAFSNSSMFWKVRAMPSAAMACGGLSDSSWPSKCSVPVVGW